MLQALSARVPQDATLGDLVDAARSLGWSDPMGTLTLQDFADALLGQEAELDQTAPAPSEPAPQPTATTPNTRAAKASTGTRKLPAASKTTPSKPSKPNKPNKTSASAALEGLKSKLDADEPMSLEEAAEALIPIVGNMKTATMQQLEEFTGIGRRKLRFHIGQLVRHGHLERHGMGRGTHYTTCS